MSRGIGKGVAVNSDVEQQIQRETDLVDEVVASFAQTPDPRLRLVMGSLVRHLHAFLREVRLTESEWETAIAFLTRAGQISDDKRQEFILLSDVLGASMQTVAINAPAAANATESTVFGPFFVQGAPLIEADGSIAPGMDGIPCYAHGTVTDIHGQPVAGARIEVWECDEDGFYDVQYGDDRTACRAHMFTDENGAYSFWSLRPVPYPIPFDGPVGDLLRATQRNYFRPAHIHFMVSADGLRTLVTHVFTHDSEHLDDDAVFGVKQSLIKSFEPRPAGPAPHGGTVDRDWCELEFDIVLAPES